MRFFVNHNLFEPIYLYYETQLPIFTKNTKKSIIFYKPINIHLLGIILWNVITIPIGLYV